MQRQPWPKHGGWPSSSNRHQDRTDGAMNASLEHHAHAYTDSRLTYESLASKPKRLLKNPDRRVGMYPGTQPQSLVARSAPSLSAPPVISAASQQCLRPAQSDLQPLQSHIPSHSSLLDVGAAHGRLNALKDHVPVDLVEHAVDVVLFCDQERALPVRHGRVERDCQAARGHVGREPHPPLAIVLHLLKLVEC